MKKFKLWPLILIDVFFDDFQQKCIFDYFVRISSVFNKVLKSDLNLIQIKWRWKTKTSKLKRERICITLLLFGTIDFIDNSKLNFLIVYFARFCYSNTLIFVFILKNSNWGCSQYYNNSPQRQRGLCSVPQVQSIVVNRKTPWTGRQLESLLKHFVFLHHSDV